MSVHVGPWREIPHPSDAPYVVGTWEMARIGSSQHPLQVRALWDGDELLAVGGAVELARADALAFVWQQPDLSPMMWRRIVPALVTGLWSCHERGIRRISAIVAAGHAAAIRLVKRVGFAFAGIETGFGGTVEPMLRYVRCWPAFDDPPLIRYQLAALERECFATWCPELSPGLAS